MRCGSCKQLLGHRLIAAGATFTLREDLLVHHIWHERQEWGHDDNLALFQKKMAALRAGGSFVANQ
jgi:hypothetical protein